MRTLVQGWDLFDKTLFDVLEGASDEQLARWRDDVNLKQHDRDRCAEELSDRATRKAKADRTAPEPARVFVPFDPRTEVSADAKRIVANQNLNRTMSPSTNTCFPSPKTGPMKPGFSMSVLALSGRVFGNWDCFCRSARLPQRTIKQTK